MHFKAYPGSRGDRCGHACGNPVDLGPLRPPGGRRSMKNAWSAFGGPTEPQRSVERTPQGLSGSQNPHRVPHGKSRAGAEGFRVWRHQISPCALRTALKLTFWAYSETRTPLDRTTDKWQRSQRRVYLSDRCSPRGVVPITTFSV